MAVDPIHQAPSQIQPNKDKPGAEVDSKQSIKDLGGLISSKKQAGQGLAKHYGSSVQLEISQNVSMGVNKNAAQMLVETEVRTSLAAKISNSQLPAQRPSLTPEDKNLTPEKIADRLVDYALNLLEDSNPGGEISRAEVDQLREAAGQGFETASKILGETPSNELKSLVGDIRTIFLERLEELTDQSVERAAENPAGAGGELFEQIAMENSRALEETEGGIDLSGWADRE